MPWGSTKPPVTNNKTLKAKKLDAKADRQLRKSGRTGNAGDLERSIRTRNKADRVAKRGGWF